VILVGDKFSNDRPITINIIIHRRTKEKPERNTSIDDNNIITTEKIGCWKRCNLYYRLTDHSTFRKPFSKAATFTIITNFNLQPPI
jgi:hypothetical protein